MNRTTLSSRFAEIAGLDLRALAFMRMALALVLLADLFSRAYFLEAHYSNTGLFSVELMKIIVWEKWYFSFHALGDSVLYEGFLFGIAAFFALMLLLGYKTQFACIASWILLISLQNRNQLVLNGGDTLLRMLLFWAMFLPLGAKLSLDHRSYSKNDFENNNRFVSLAGFGLLVQFFLVYFLSSLGKNGSSWNDGSAFMNVFRMDDLLSSFGEKLVLYPKVLSNISPFVYYGQMIFPFFLLIPNKTNRFRNIALLFFLCLHLFIFLFFDLGIFSWVCIAGLLAFLPSSFMNFIFGQSTKGSFVENRQSMHLLSAIALIYTMLMAAQGSGYVQLSNFLQVPAKVWRLDQQWNMFNSSSLSQSVSVQIISKNREGILNEIQPAHSNVRWRNFLNMIPYAKPEALRNNFCRYACQSNVFARSNSKETLILEMKTVRFKSNVSADTVYRLVKECDCATF